MTKLEQEIRVAAFEWLIARVARSNEGNFEYRPSIQVSHGSRVAPLKRVPRLTLRTDAEKLFQENHYGTDGEPKTQPLPEPVVARLKNLWGTELRKKGTPPQKKTKGVLLFHQCTLWWDGKETALVCTEYSYNFDDKSQGDGGNGSAVGMAVLVTRHNGKWQVTDFCGTLAAG